MMTLPRRFERDARLRAKSMALVAAVLLLAGCTSQSGLPGHIDSPEAAAHQLADGIAKMDLSPVPFAGATGAQINQQLSPLVSGMGPRKPAVAVGPVVAEKTAATVTLHLSWAFPGVQQPWSYDSSAHLVRDSGQWKVQWQPSIVEPSLDGANRLTQRRLQPTRGEVLGQAGEAIVKSRPVVRIGIDKSQVSATAATVSAGRLAKLVGIDPKAYAGKVAAAGPAAFVEAIVLRATGKDRPLNKSVFAIPGALPIEGEQSLAPSREFARALLGTVGEASKEIVDSSNGTVVAGDEVGLSGLQRRYDGQLRGTPGVLVQIVAAKPSSTTGPAPTASPSPSSNPTASPSPSSPPAASPSPSLQPTASPSPSLQPTASPSPVPIRRPTRRAPFSRSSRLPARTCRRR